MFSTAVLDMLKIRGKNVQSCVKQHRLAKKAGIEVEPVEVIIYLFGSAILLSDVSFFISNRFDRNEACCLFHLKEKNRFK